MNYSLGNMLGGAGALNADKLALNLQFATDKTLTARKGPTPVFTRASSATQVGASGLIEFAPENLYQRSQEFNEAFWIKTRLSITANATTAPDGTLTADKLVEDTSASTTHTIGSTVTPPSTPHTFSVFVKKAERSFVALRISGLNDFFNLDTGVALTNQSSPTITNFGNGWYRCTVTGAFGTQASVHMSADGITTSYTGDGTSGIFIWGAQFEAYSTARAYIPTTTAAVYGARFDHDPITIACKGLLIEESRTNLITNSGNALLWPSTGTDEGSLTAPDGSSNGKLVGVGTVGITTSSVSATAIAYSFSVFVKRNNTDWFRLQLNHATNTNTANAWFNLATGSTGSVSVGTGSFASLSSAIVPLGNGWYRCIIIGTPPSSGSLTGNIISATADNSVTRVAGSIYGIWGAQLEAGAFPTSYIPTTTASVVRSADICSITGANFTSLYNATEGTLLLSADEFRRGISFGYYLRITDSAVPISNRYSIGAYGSKTGVPSPIELLVSSGASPQYSVLPTSSSSNFKAAITYKLDDMRGALNGTLEAADVPPSALIIGANALQISGVGIHIAAVRYYRKRLANAKLASLTA